MTQSLAQTNILIHLWFTNTKQEDWLSAQQHFKFADEIALWSIHTAKLRHSPAWSNNSCI
jgi:hypothetical protein